MPKPFTAAFHGACIESTMLQIDPSAVISEDDPTFHRAYVAWDVFVESDYRLHDAEIDIDEYITVDEQHEFAAWWGILSHEDRLLVTGRTIQNEVHVPSACRLILGRLATIAGA